jgi:hypothetical protein
MIYTSDLATLSLVQERHIICRRGLSVDILEPNVHGSHSDAKLVEAREEVEEVVGSEGEFGGLDMSGTQAQIRECCSEDRSGRGRKGVCGHWNSWARTLAIRTEAWPGALPLVLESICKGFFMSSYEMGQILA